MHAFGSTRSLHLIVHTGAAGILEHALVVEGTAELHVAALQALLTLAADHPPLVQQRYSSRLSWLQGFLSHVDAAGELHFACGG